MRIDESEVLLYLRRNPGVLAKHPEVLAELELPHACGGAVSLLEHQIAALRARNARLRGRLHELIDNARENEAFVKRLLTLSLRLFDCADIADVRDRLYRCLGEDFDVDEAALRVFARARGVEPAGGEELGIDEEAKALFARILETGKPICGRLGRQQLRVLFGDAGERIRSSVLLPLGEAMPLGVLALGSADPQRFHPAQATDLLGDVGRVVTRAILPFVSAA